MTPEGFLDTDKKILFATDFTDTSNAAKATVQSLQQQLDAEVTVLHVFDKDQFDVPSPYYFMPGASDWFEKHEQKLKEKGKSALAKLCEEINRSTGQFVEGKPADEILDFAKNNETHMIIMGTHGHRGIGRVLVGSIAEEVFRRATCPVLIVKAKK